MALSAPGIGSGLDIKGIVSQLVELEKKPLAQLTTQASSTQAKLSAFGQLKSQMANLQDQSTKLVLGTSWDVLGFSSSNSAAVSGSINQTTAQATSFSVQVSQLAQAQAAASGVFAADKTFGAGQLSIDLGSWNEDNDAFTAGAAAAITVDIAAGDKLADVARKINAKNAGVTAAVLTDASGSRLTLQSSKTGTEAAFRVQSSGDASLQDLRYNPAVGGAGMARSLEAKNTLATVNGVDVSSTNNTLANAVPGVTLNFQQVTTAPVTIKVAQDSAAIKGNINGLVQSFNALASALREMTKYEAGTKTAGTLQGDSTAVGLQNALRRLFSDRGPAASSFGRLSDIGVEFQLDGSLKVNDTKLSAAMENPEALEKFFNAASTGMAVRIESFAKGMLGASGGVASRHKALQSTLDRNTKDQQRLTEKLERTEARLLAQYARLDTNLANLNALSSYVSQQVTTWNNQKGN